MATESIRDLLEKRKANQQYRFLRTVDEYSSNEPVVTIGGKKLVNFCSNDYLGLANHPLLKERSSEFTNRYGTGATASRLICGNYSCHDEIEQKLATWLGVDAVLLFNTGYQANATLLPALADRNSLILIDKLSHNSLLQGLLAGQARYLRFRHNDMDHLQQLLQREISRYEQVYIVTESIFSMDGDPCDLSAISSLAEEYGAFLYVDEAHAIGIIGKEGRGLSEARRTNLYLGTMGKAFGSMGAFAAGSHDLKDYLINYCPGFIYSTGVSPSVVGALDAALELIPKMDKERNQVAGNARYLRSELQKMGYNTGSSDSQIIPIIVGSEKKALDLSKYLEDEGFLVSAIRPPTVSANASRLRVTITARHKKMHLDSLLHSIKKIA